LQVEIVSTIRCQLPDMNIGELRLAPQPDADIIGQIESVFSDEKLDALFVYDLDQLFDAGRGGSAGVANLNLNRDAVALQFSYPFVFWITKFGLRQFSREAPDLWAGRSGTFQFTPEERHTQAHH
jgi:hypothetical protein